MTKSKTASKAKSNHSQDAERYSPCESFAEAVISFLDKDTCSWKIVPREDGSKGFSLQNFNSSISINYNSYDVVSICGHVVRFNEEDTCAIKDHADKCIERIHMAEMIRAIQGIKP